MNTTENTTTQQEETPTQLDEKTISQIVKTLQFKDAPGHAIIPQETFEEFNAKVLKEYPTATAIKFPYGVHWVIKHPWSEQFRIAWASPKKTSLLSKRDEHNMSYHLYDINKYTLRIVYGYNVYTTPSTTHSTDGKLAEQEIGNPQ